MHTATCIVYTDKPSSGNRQFVYLRVLGQSQKPLPLLTLQDVSFNHLRYKLPNSAMLQIRTCT
jgi:hypothetical protein